MSHKKHSTPPPGKEPFWGNVFDLNGDGKTSEAEFLLWMQMGYEATKNMGRGRGIGPSNLDDDFLLDDDLLLDDEEGLDDLDDSEDDLGIDLDAPPIHTPKVETPEEARQRKMRAGQETEPKPATVIVISVIIFLLYVLVLTRCSVA
jgi:hypothetical protein